MTIGVRVFVPPSFASAIRGLPGLVTRAGPRVFISQRIFRSRQSARRASPASFRTLLGIGLFLPYSGTECKYLAEEILPRLMSPFRFYSCRRRASGPPLSTYSRVSSRWGARRRVPTRRFSLVPRERSSKRRLV